MLFKERADSEQCSLERSERRRNPKIPRGSFQTRSDGNRTRLRRQVRQLGEFYESERQGRAGMVKQVDMGTIVVANGPLGTNRPGIGPNSKKKGQNVTSSGVQKTPVNNSTLRS